jgi:diguanylate cyclase (GGDEF)-like protein
MRIPKFLVTSIYAFLCAFSAFAHAAVERHALELAATNNPKVVIAQVPPLLDKALIQENWREASLLQLAQANACRVLADWSCQRNSAVAAESYAVRANQPLLQVRAQISQSRSQAALQDFSQAESTLAKAELQLQKTPLADLSAEIMLAYSSISFQVGRFQSSLEYTERGTQLFNQTQATARASDLGTQVRLLRNQARAQIELGNPEAARTALASAIAMNKPEEDLKLAGELYLELARLERKLQLIDQQVQTTAKVVALSKKLPNSQLHGQALEVQGLTAMDLGRTDEGMRLLEASYQNFRSLNLRRDALRVLRELLPSAVKLKSPQQNINALTTELIELQQRIDIEDKSLAAANFDSRLAYAKREFELNQLARDNQTMAANQRLLRSNRNLAIAAAALGVCLALAALVFAALQLRARRKLAESGKKLLAITENIPAEIAHFNTNYEYLFVNSRGAQSAGIHREALIGQSMLSIAPEAASQRKLMADCAMSGEPVRFEESLMVNEGTNNPIAHHYETIFVPDFVNDGTDTTKGFFALRFDISRLKHAESELAKIADQDSLTGLWNRRGFNQKLDKAMASALAKRSALSVLAIDVDRFKYVNDTHGHLVGDEVLKTVARAVTESVRQSDTAARVGGDEFLVLLEQAPNLQIVAGIAEKIREHVLRAKPVKDLDLQVTLSIGIAHCEAASTTQDLLALADAALYDAKRSGRNAVRSKIAA